MNEYIEFLNNTTDSDPAIAKVRGLVARELKRLKRVKGNQGRPRLEESPQRAKWRAYQQAHRAKAKGHTT